MFRPDAEELLEIKRGKWPLSKVKSHADELFAAMREARDASKLPNEPDRDEAEKLLIRLIRDSIVIN